VSTTTDITGEPKIPLAPEFHGVIAQWRHTHGTSTSLLYRPQQKDERYDLMERRKYSSKTKDSEIRNILERA